MNALSPLRTGWKTSTEEPLMNLISYEMPPLKMRQIVNAVARMHDVSLSDILSTKRQKKLVEARHLAIYACTRLTVKNYCEIGRFFDRDHSTVMYVTDKLSGENVPPETLEKIAGLANIY